MAPGADAERRSGYRIAHVEDNPADVFLLRYALDIHDVSYELIVVPDGLEAIRLVENIERGEAAAPDVFVIDLNLPIHTGLEVLARIRASDILRRSLAVVLTTSESEPEWAAAHQIGIDLYLRKPLSLDDFAALGHPLKLLMQERLP